MARQQMFRVEGLKELEEALKELPRATARSTLRRTLIVAAQPIARAGEAYAPRRTGELAQSYTVGSRLSRRQRRLHKKESQVEVFVGPTAHPKSVQTEFGNAHQAAEPHLRPAWDGNVMGVLDRIRQILAEQIEKTRTRLARKAAREAAKLAQSQS